jgi:mRNA interferase RelE/StbE
MSQRVLSKATALGENPRPHGCLKMEGGEGLWRVRLGDYRMIYTIDDSLEVIEVRIVAHRREVYRK